MDVTDLVFGGVARALDADLEVQALTGKRVVRIEGSGLGANRDDGEYLNLTLRRLGLQLHAHRQISDG